MVEENLLEVSLVRHLVLDIHPQLRSDHQEVEISGKAAGGDCEEHPVLPAAVPLDVRYGKMRPPILLRGGLRVGRQLEMPFKSKLGADTSIGRHCETEDECGGDLGGGEGTRDGSMQ